MFEEGKKDQARQAYSRVLHDPKSLITDSTLFMRYGELSAAAGKKSEAREFFVKVLNGHEPEFLGKLAGQTTDGMSLSELHSSALAVESDFYRGDTRSGEYQRRTLAAVAADPNSYIALMARADALYMAGHLADSRAEFDRAIKQAPAAVRDQIEPWIDVTYPFRSWDHVSSGVIRNGKVTITRKKVPLPNNLVDRGKYSTGGLIRRDRP